MLKGLQKNLKSHHAIALLGFLILVLAVSQFSERKASEVSTFTTGGPAHHAAQHRSPAAVAVTQAADAAPPQTAPHTAHQAGGLAPSCGKKQDSQLLGPSDLLPSSKVDFADGNNMGNVNMLSAGALVGINTVGGSLRNANLQVRSEPPNPQTKVSPWLNTTIEPDLMRVPLEVGCGPQ